MAAPVATIGDVSVIQDILRQQINPEVKNQINWIDVLLEDGITFKGEYDPQLVKVENNKYEITSLVSGMQAYSAGESANLISSGIGLKKMYVQPYFARTSYILTDVQIAETLSSKAALLQSTELYGMEIRRALLRKKGRDLRGDGTGIMGILPAGAQTSNLITISTKARGTVASQNIYGLGANQVFQIGANIELGTEAAFAAGTQVQAKIVDIPSDSVLKLDATYTVGAASGANNRGGTNADTWHIRFAGEYLQTPMGLLGLVDDGTFVPSLTTIQGLVRADFPFMRSVVRNPANSTNILSDFTELYDSTYRFNSELKYFVVSTDVYFDYTNALSQTMVANQNTSPYESKLGKGHTGLMFAYGNKPMAILRDWLLPAGTVLLLDSDQYFLAQLVEDSYVDDGIMTRIPGTTKYETVRVSYYNFGTFGSRKLGGRIQYIA